MIKKIYLKLLSSTVYVMKNSEYHKGIWRSSTILFMTSNISFNLITCFLILKSLFKTKFYYIFPFVNDNYLNDVFNFILYFFAIPFIINLYFIYGKGFKKVDCQLSKITKAPFTIYFVTSWLSLLIIFLIVV